MARIPKRAALLLENQYEDLEFWYPRFRLEEEGFEVVVIAPEKGKIYHSKHGYPARSDESAGEVQAVDFRIVIVPGGYAPDYMRRYESMVYLVKDAAERGRIVGAICHGGWMLASAEVAEGRTLTSHEAIRDDLRHAGANWVDGEVVVDGNIITSRKPRDLPAFMRAILEAERATRRVRRIA